MVLSNRHRIDFLGIGHSLGSELVSNTELARTLGVSPDWLVRRTGIAERRVTGDGQDTIGFAADAVAGACDDAGIPLRDLGPETLMLHVQPGPIAFVPPASIRACARLGLDHVRALDINGVCGEPVAALDLGVQMLAAGRCRRVILSAAFDFQAFVGPAELGTVGLFGSGGAAVIIEAGEPGSDGPVLRGLHWETHAGHWHLGRAEMTGFTKHETGVGIDYEYYTMDGLRLAKVALDVVPGVVTKVLDAAGWKQGDIDLLIAHQPNARLLELGARRLGFDLSIVPMPVTRMGNMGSAAALVNLSIAKRQGLLRPGCKMLLLTFGIGFTCGAAAFAL